MGTRSRVDFVDAQGRTLVSVYRQYDGYPSGRGDALVTFLKRQSMVNGLGIDQDMSEGEWGFPPVSNGFDELAAHWVFHEKRNSPSGGVYLMAPGTDCGEDYRYEVRECVKGGVNGPQEPSGLLLTCWYQGWLSPEENPDGKLQLTKIFCDQPQNFVGSEVEKRYNG